MVKVVPTYEDGVWQGKEEAVGGSQPLVSGNGPPNGAVVPTSGKPLYVDLTDLAVYCATGATHDDWIQIGGLRPSDFDVVTGVSTDSAGRVIIASDDTVVITDPDSWNGDTENSAYWQNNGGVGKFALELGSSGQYIHNWLGEDGSYFFPSGLIGTLWGVRAADGLESFHGTSEPADGDVASNERVQWYDATIGAPKFGIKQRDDGGTLYKRIGATLTEDATAFAGVTKPDLPTNPTAAQIAAVLSTLGLVNLT